MRPRQQGWLGFVAWLEIFTAAVSLGLTLLGGWNGQVTNLVVVLVGVLICGHVLLAASTKSDRQ